MDLVNVHSIINAIQLLLVILLGIGLMLGIVYLALKYPPVDLDVESSLVLIGFALFFQLVQWSWKAMCRLSKGQPIFDRQISRPVPTSVYRLAIDHPLKSLTTKENILRWLLKNTPESMPEAMLDRFHLNDEWRIRYTSLPLDSFNLSQLKKIAKHFGVEPTGQKNIKASWVSAIAQKEQEHLDSFLKWSDDLARSIKE